MVHMRPEYYIPPGNDTMFESLTGPEAGIRAKWNAQAWSDDVRATGRKGVVLPQVQTVEPL
jgi:hypothetical protein